ncbi:hypothetical protein [Mailhella sp.]|uniref:hypothetical protein n=1 Tax=Mailhella sp. TaxID=1981029 RepID=UPI0040648CCE
MSLFSRLIAAQKGCPFCNFNPCNMEKCMFFIGVNNENFDCILLKTYGNSAAAAAYSHFSTFAIPHKHMDFLFQLSPEALRKRLDRIQETLESLDEAIAFPILPEALQKELEGAHAKLSDYREQVFSALEVVSPRQAKKSSVRTRKKS